MKPLRYRYRHGDEGKKSAMAVSHVIKSYKQNRLKALATMFFVKGLVIVLLASCYIYSRVEQSVSTSWQAADGGPRVAACVRRIENQCQAYPCEEIMNGEIKEVADYPPHFGYFILVFFSW